MHLGHILTVINRRPLFKRHAQAESPDGGFHDLKQRHCQSITVAELLQRIRTSNHPQGGSALFDALHLDRMIMVKSTLRA